MLILTIDIGLTNCKASAFNSKGELLQQVVKRYPTITERAEWSEQDPNDWLQATKESIQELVQSTGLNASGFDTIAVTAHMHGLVAVDGAGEPLTHCWTLFDRRSVEEAREIRQKLGDSNAYRLTGARLEAYTPAAKILWLKRNHPDIFNRTAQFLAPKDMLRVLLGGDVATDPIDAAGMLLYDIEARSWSQEILATIGLPQEKLPEIRPSYASGGSLSSEAARELGLKAGTPLIVGAGDDIEALGAGVVDPGQTLEHIGTTGTMITCLDRLIFDQNRAVELYPHGLPNRYLLGGATNAAGRSLEWALKLLDFENTEGEMLPLRHPPLKDQLVPPIYLPFISGERGLIWESHATGGFLGLRERHTSYDLALAVYHGVAFSMKEFLVEAAQIGAEPTSIISGTPPDPRQWSQLRADIYGIPISFLETSYPTGLGIALLALVQNGVFSCLEQAVEKCCRVVEQIDPNPDWEEYFQEKFEIYEAAVQQCKDLFPKLI